MDLLRLAVFGMLLTTASRFDWDVFLSQNDRAKEVIAVHEETFEVRSEQCGKTDPLTLQSYLGGGEMKCFQGHFKEAEYGNATFLCLPSSMPNG